MVPWPTWARRARSCRRDAAHALVAGIYASFFPVIAAVFLLRSFVWSRSRSRRLDDPTLQIGDFILVNKYTYGVRLPIVNKKLVELNQPHAAM